MATDEAHNLVALRASKEAFAVFRTLVAGCEALPTIFTQDALPPEVTGCNAYLRKHRERMRSWIPDWTKSGKMRAVTADAWAADVDAETPRTARGRPKTAVDIAGEEISRRLGIRMHPAARKSP